jgi:hypothetical protein
METDGLVGRVACPFPDEMKRIVNEAKRACSPIRCSLRSIGRAFFILPRSFLLSDEVHDEAGTLNVSDQSFLSDDCEY